MKFVLIIVGTLFFGKVYAQTNSNKHNNTIGWYNYYGTFQVSEKLGVHTEYQWRRNHLITDWQQSLLRIGVNYNLKQNILLRAGYAWVETFPYSDYPLNVFGKEYTEHRTFQMMQFTHKAKAMDFSHRFMLEQRFVGKYSSENEPSEDQFPLLHRIRYMIRVQRAFNGREIKDKSSYAVVYNEIFLGFGKNSATNVFDQNRLGILIGYRFNSTIKIEGGYLNQTLRFSRKIDDLTMFQLNNGIILNANFTINCTKKRKK